MLNLVISKFSIAAAVALTAGVGFTQSASALGCGGIEYPSCKECVKSLVAAQFLPHSVGCEACGGICYQLARTNPDGSKTETQVTKLVNPLRDVKRGNFIEISNRALLEIGQVNPMVALVLQAYTPGNEPRTGSFRLGKVSFAEVPTLRTLQLSLQNDDSTTDRGFAAVSDPKNYAGLRWQSRLLPTGDLEVTFLADELDADDVAVKQLYPSLKVVLKNSQPSSIVSWQIAN